ncbi:hypothetical protein BpHYR1_042488 [Brachionus plicatilis]|uniref:Uncharacterized protein n=1 Tax=Brachionus plicatilis TaxID=10195 RepID=A0A3M7SXE1_BRAPC|nr:hypothetical protein BpHYR1_042488 [Brachionus plicatilis]
MIYQEIDSLNTTSYENTEQSFEDTHTYQNMNSRFNENKKNLLMNCNIFFSTLTFTLYQISSICSRRTKNPLKNAFYTPTNLI